VRWAVDLAAKGKNGFDPLAAMAIRDLAVIQPEDLIGLERRPLWQKQF